MLPATHRMRRGGEFTAAVRSGRRAGRPSLVLHLSAAADPSTPARVGFVVSRAVGNAVVRNRVKRRLRHLMAARLSRVPDGVLLVVRANPGAAALTSAGLGADLDRLLAKVLSDRPGVRR